MYGHVVIPTSGTYVDDSNARFERYMHSSNGQSDSVVHCFERFCRPLFLFSSQDADHRDPPAH